MNSEFKEFFASSEWLDYLVLRPLSHINMSWELRWNYAENEYFREEGTYAPLLNDLIVEISNTVPPAKYHDNEDCLAEYVKKSLNWGIYKENGKWRDERGVYNIRDYGSILEQGGFDDLDEKNLVLAATGRIKAAINHGQVRFDDMEESHQHILAEVLAIIIYHRIPYMDE